MCFKEMLALLQRLETGLMVLLQNHKVGGGGVSAFYFKDTSTALSEANKIQVMEAMLNEADGWTSHANHVLDLKQDLKTQEEDSQEIKNGRKKTNQCEEK